MVGFYSSQTHKERRETMSKSGIKAFFLGFIPGMGHLYLGKKGRGILYPIIFTFVLFAFTLLAASTGSEEPFLVGLFICFLIWVVSIFDLVVTANNYLMSRRSESPTAADQLNEGLN